MKSLIAATLILVAVGIARADNWPQWRGPQENGVAPTGNPPTEWSESENIRWKVPIPGRGLATPIVWGDRIYIQTAVETARKPGANKGGETMQSSQSPIPDSTIGDDAASLIVQDPPRGPRGGRGPGGRMGGRRGGFGGGRQSPTNPYDFEVIAIDRKTGEQVWEKTVVESVPHESGHPDASQASNSPLTDGEHIYAYFGSRGLYCLDMDGGVVWSRDFGRMQTAMGFGEGSSPALADDSIIVNWDHEGDDFIVALDKKTGKDRWRVPRDEHTTWATPLIVKDKKGRTQVITSATGAIRAYDLKNGKLLWQCKGMTNNVIPSPVAGDGLAIATSGFRGNAMLAVKYDDAKGDVTGTKAVAWSYDGPGTPYVPSPLLYKGCVYVLDNTRSILSCFDAKTGQKHYDKQRLEGLQGVYASPVGCHGRVYIVDRDGTTAVIAAGPKFKLLATNILPDNFDASPAIAGNELFLRGHKNLYCIARN